MSETEVEKRLPLTPATPRGKDRWGLLLINLGTPAAPTTAAVRRYLAEFLSDPRVVTAPALIRYLLLYLIILPFRSPKSAHAYQAIWTEEGSPLLVYGQQLRDAVQAHIDERWGEVVRVELAMRYGEPSLPQALEALRAANVDRIVALPLYPQYASSTWGSTAERLQTLAARLENIPALDFVPPFYDHPAYLEAQVAVARPVLDEFQPDHVLMSFHGVPTSHLKQTDEGRGHCLAADYACCAQVSQVNRYCYRAHCVATAREVANRLGLADDKLTITFQSRLGPVEWIKPYTDEEIVRLAQSGVKKLAIMSPAFVADCLETLEELQIANAELFREHGGEELKLVPSLNAHQAWVEAVVQIARDRSSLGALLGEAAAGPAGGSESTLP